MAVEYVDDNPLDVCLQHQGKKMTQSQAVKIHQGLTYDQRMNGCMYCTSSHRKACIGSVDSQASEDTTIFCVEKSQYVPRENSTVLLQPVEPSERSLKVDDEHRLVDCPIANRLVKQDELQKLFVRHGHGNNATCEKCRKCSTAS